MKSGIWYAVGAYAAWGLLPIYWKLLSDVPAPQLLAHRIVWSFITLVIVVVAMRQWRAFAAIAGRRRVLVAYTAAALLIGVNWLTYVYGVNAGFIVETSLGYFINPLLSVALGVLVLRERLRPIQWLPIVLASAGVTYLTVAYGSLPWIALVLALTFALYGLIKKTVAIGSLFGLTLETGILLLPATVYLTMVESGGSGALAGATPTAIALLVGAGVMTTLPLLMFASAASRIPLSLVGILQYIAPTLQFLIGVLVYDEPMTRARLVGFGLVWIALVIFAVESVVAHRRMQAVPVTAPQAPLVETDPG
jgi:chloramphenicol-sensitive protein RarD